MKSFLTLPYLLSLVLAGDGQRNAFRTPPTLDPLVPIHLGEIFWPPSMTFIAWLPTSISNALDFCSKATEASHQKLFSLNGVDALQVHDYFAEHAYITRGGMRYAECYVTPESVKMGICRGVEDGDGESGHRFHGPGTRKWTCWIRHPMGRNIVESDRAIGRGDILTDAKYTPTGVVLGAAVSSVMMGAFTPGVTGG